MFGKDWNMIQQLCTKEVLLETAKEVFESMIFMDINEAHEPAQKAESWTLLSSITFKGAFHGCLIFSCDISCAQAITKNMLGIDTTEELSEEEVCDALGEVVNMVMGSVKSRLQDNFGDVKVSIPTTINGRKLCNNNNNLGIGTTELSIEIDIDSKYTATLSLLYRKTLKTE